MSAGAHEKPEILELEAQHYAAIRRKVPQSALHEFFDHGFNAVLKVMSDQGLMPAGPPMAVYHSMPGETVDVSIGYPTSVAITPTGDVAAGMLPSGDVVSLRHTGPYDLLPQSYAILQDWITDRALVAGQTIWEVYVTEPSASDPAKTITEIRWTVTLPTGGSGAV